MAYGTGTFGILAWGSTGSGGPGPVIVSSSPVPNETGVAINAPVTITFQSAAGIDRNLLTLNLNGAQAVVGGLFVGAFGGTVTEDATSLTITVSTHPDFVGGLPVTVTTTVRDLANVLGSFSWVFHVGFAVIEPAESVPVAEAAATAQVTEAQVAETVPVLEAGTGNSTAQVSATELVPSAVVLWVPENDLYFDESVALSDAMAINQGYWTPVTDTVTVTDAVVVRAFLAEVESGTLLRLEFPADVRIEEAIDPTSYRLGPSGSGVPLTILGIEPIWPTLRSGSGLTVIPGTDFWSSDIMVSDGSFTPDDVGRYLHVDGQAFQVTAVSPLIGNICTIAGRLPILPNPARAWAISTAVQGVRVTTNKTTNDAWYRVQALGLRNWLTGTIVQGTADFQGVSGKPRVLGAVADAEGTITVEYDYAMRMDGEIMDPGQYSIPGVRITLVTTPDDRHVALHTVGLGDGSHTLTVNATGTPKDEAGNPIDPTFNQAIFTGSVPLNVRSVFTDHGPLTKPPEDLQSGTGASILNETDVEIPGATILPAHVGLYIILSGTSLNAGSFRISARLGATRVRLKASFNLYDPASGSLGWLLQDPRNGTIADDPADVTVRVNSLPVTPDAVVGLLGQVILPVTPAPTDDVQIDYHWCQNPVVEVRRLNSKEFRLNCWNRDLGAQSDTQHKYRFNTVLVTPAEYVPDDPQALLDQPLLRDLHYRAYERAYTAALNDPTLLTLNAPIHRIAYAPMSREVSGSFIRYEAATLPENDATNPWTRRGSGTASVLGGVLTVIDNSSGAYPTGQPIFWTRDIDLSFPAAFATSWRGYVSNATEPDGVFVGVAAGHGDGERLVMVGCLLVGGIRKIGLLVQGGGNDPALLASWSGGLDVNGTPTGVPADFDWSTLHSYRTYRDPDGTIRVFVDGSVVETLRLTHDELPYLEELDDPFDGLQGVFFGAVSRPARSESKWDFFRYIVLPLSPYQVAPTSFVNYEGDVLPEDAAAPWTPVGHHGVETLLANDVLLLDSTSASTMVDVGLAGGDFRGFARIEPLLPAASEVLVDLEAQVITHTHGITPNAVMAAVDDGNRLLQLCFFPDQAVPKISYGGRALPTDAPWNWLSDGTAPAAMEGQVLRITDDSLVDGRVFYALDTAPPGPTRIISGTTDWMVEFRFAVVSWTAEPGPDPAFTGAMAQVYDDTRLVGLMTCTVAGVPTLAFHSDGATISTVAFDWSDGAQHTYRLIKNTAGDAVSLFIDGVFAASVAYSGFLTPAPDPVGMVSFGSATPASTLAKSVVDWTYANVWRTTTGFRRYVGIWKGTDSDSLVGYHLPLKASGQAASVAGNGLGDSFASFLVAGVTAGDKLIIDSGPNKGVYEVAGVSGPTTLTIVGTFPLSPTMTPYRIAAQTDWSLPHRYRLIRSPLGDISLLLDADPTPLVTISYGVLDLPPSGAGIVRTLTTGMPGIAWGAFDPNNLSQVAWWHVRYGISRSPTELRIAPHHQFQYQWNVMSSPEHLRTLIAHPHTGYLSCSTGIPPNVDPDLFDDPALAAYTQLNDGTPLVPLTQSWEVRRPAPVEVPIAGLNRIEDVLNTDPDFVLNDSRTRIEIVVPDDVLYTSLTVTEQTTGEVDLLKPFDDWCMIFKDLQYCKEVCLSYDGSVLPEDDAAAPTPWVREDEAGPSTAHAAVAAGILTYGSGSGGTRTIYRNRTPLTDAPGLEVEASYRIRVAQDTTFGMGDTCMRIGLSGLGYTVGLAFITSSGGQRMVLAYDMTDGRVLGATLFDYYDGVFHTYKVIRDIKHNMVRIEVVA